MKDKSDECHKCGQEMRETKLEHVYTQYGPKPIKLIGMPGKKCVNEVCGNEWVSIRTLNVGTDFLRKIERGSVMGKEEDGIIVAEFPEK